MSFVHLHAHTEYSILDSTNKIKDYVKRVKELGMTAAAITDHGVLYGVLQFYKTMKAEGLNPVIGCEVYVAPETRFKKDEKNRYYHLVLLAENNTGYSNLIKLVSEGFKEGYYYKPRVDHELLREYHEGLIALSGCVAGEIPRAILKGEYEKARDTARLYQEIFGKDNFFLELQDHGLLEQQKCNAELLRISDETGIPLAATNDCHYTLAEDAQSQEFLWCIRDKKEISDVHRSLGTEFYVKSEDEMKNLFLYAPEAIENTQKIADRCKVEIEFHNTKMPAYEVPKGYDTWTYLNKLCHDGLKKRYPADDGTLLRQLDYELSVIRSMGYVEYFLIVWDFINWARMHDIPVGPGRGSAAGSLVSYTTGITDIDPIRYHLLFERFLNPERVSMPDIDVDFCMERRQEVIDYVAEKYGAECVTQIITFGTMAARMVIKDVGKAMGLPFTVTNKISSMIPEEPGITLAGALKKNPELKGNYDTDMGIKKLLDTCMKLEGLPRQTGKHAAGVIICDKPVVEYIPTARAVDGEGFVSQFTMTEVEELGLLKMDFLGLRTLTAIEYAKKSIQKNYGVSVDMNRIDYDDKNVLDFLGNGRISGVFQLESEGMQKFMHELKPQSIEDLIAGISLYRPGPMDFIPDYIRGKNNTDSITYDCPQLKPILEPTYGCIVYQEQVMQIVRDLGGYTMGRSDLVRRAMSKKKQKVMEEERKNFIFGNKKENVPGCIANGISEEVAGKIYNDMMDFAKYAFNKSHAAAYAVISYQTAWLKYYYPKEYMAAVMTSVIDNSEKLSGYIACTKTEGIRLYPPDINNSRECFSTTEDGIVFALNGVQGVSTASAKSIVDDRGAGYTTFGAAVSSMKRSGINKSAAENLIKAGAFDSFGGRRSQYLTVIGEALKQMSKSEKKSIGGQITLLDFAEAEEKKAYEDITLPELPELPVEDLLQMEKEVCGVFISSSPLEQYRSAIDAAGTANTVKAPEDQRNTICGMVSGIKRIFTKKDGRLMAFFHIEDMHGTLKCVMFPGKFAEYGSFLKEDTLTAVTGKISVENEKRTLLCDEISMVSALSFNVWIKFERFLEYQESVSMLDDIVSETEKKGNDELRVYIKESNAFKKIGNGKYSDERFLERLRSIFGEENVRISLVRIY